MNDSKYNEVLKGNPTIDLPLVSVIIPIYNVEQYIDKGLRQILNQEYQSIEFILVDDGSTDQSGELCDKWEKSDSRIRVFHKQNEGAGSARNVGILHSKGKYIYFFDIDDEADTSLIAYCVKIMETKEVDYILFGFRTLTPYLNNLEDKVTFQEKMIFSNEELKQNYIDTFLLCKYGNGFPWNKFYRKSFLLEHHLFFENQRIQQDEVFNLNIYRYLGKAYISSKVFYTYYIYEKGNTRVRFIPDRFDIYVSVRDHFETLIKHWNLKDERVETYLNKRFYSNLMTCITYNLFHKNCVWNMQEKKKEIQRMLEHPYSKLALCCVTDSSIENRLYLYFAQKGCLLLMHYTMRVFQFLRKVKHLVS